MIGTMLEDGRRPGMNTRAVERGGGSGGSETVEDVRREEAIYVDACAE